MGSIFAIFASLITAISNTPRMVNVNTPKERKALLKGFREEAARDANERIARHG